VALVVTDSRRASTHRFFVSTPPFLFFTTMNRTIALFWILSALFFAPLVAQLPNGDMSQGELSPKGWTLWVGTAPIILARDTSFFFSAPASLLLDGQKGAYGVAYLPLPITFRQGTLRGIYHLVGKPEETFIALQVFDAAKKQIDWVNFVSESQNGIWQEFEGSYTLSPEAATANLVVSLKGDGKIWLDDLSLKGVEERTPDPAATSGADSGSISPALYGWRTWIETGALNLTRQSGFKGTASTALAATSNSAVTFGTAYFTITPKSIPATILVTGHSRQDGDLTEASIGLQFMGAANEQLGWVTLDAPGTTWSNFSTNAEWPAGAVIANVVVTVRGSGQVLLDQLSWR